MDRMISLLAALVGLIALGGAILVHTNGDAQRAQMTKEIAQLQLSVGLITQQQQKPGGYVPAPAAVTSPIAPAAVTSPIAPATVTEPVAASSAEPLVVAETSVPSAAPISSYSMPSAELPEPSSSASSSSSIAPLAAPVLAESSASEAPASIPADGTTDMKALLARIAQLEQTTRDQASELDAARAQLSSSPPPASGTGLAPASSLPPASSASATPAAVVADGPTADCIPLGTRFMGAAGDRFPICKTKLVVKVTAVVDGLATLGGAGDVAAGAFGSLDKGCTVNVFSADASGYAEMRVTCQ